MHRVRTWHLTESSARRRDLETSRPPRPPSRHLRGPTPPGLGFARSIRLGAALRAARRAAHAVHARPRSQIFTVCVACRLSALSGAADPMSLAMRASRDAASGGQGGSCVSPTYPRCRTFVSAVSVATVRSTENLLTYYVELEEPKRKGKRP